VSHDQSLNLYPRGKVKRGRLILRSGCVPLPPAGRSCRP
jgi:hypothetical protein